MYNGFENHKTFEAYKADFEGALPQGSLKIGDVSDFVLKECWLAAMAPTQAVDKFAFDKFEREIKALPPSHL